MSASREKRNRKETVITPAAETAPKKAGGAWKKALGIIAAALAVLIAIGCILISTGFLGKVSVAATVGTHKISPVEFNYFYRSVYSELSQTLGDLASDPEIIKSQALSQMKEIYAIYDQAVAEGYTLSEENKAAIDAEIESLDSIAAGYGMADGNAMLTATYGDGCNKSNYRSFREIVAIVDQYSNDKKAAHEVTADEINAYYKEHKDDFDTVTYRQFLVPVSDTMDLEQAQAAASEMEEMLKANDMEAFAAKAYELAPEENKDYYTDESAALVSNAPVSSISEDTAAWLTDSARAANDTTTIKASDDSGVFVLRFESRDDSDYKMVNVRHILVAFEDEADEASKKVTEETAKSYLEEFENGDKTEESFAELAKAHSDDGNAAEGGLYENVYRGQMVPTFNDWIFDSSRQPGDHGIVETDYGFHVMYFSGFGDNYRETQIKEILNDQYYTEWTASLTENYPAEENAFGMKFVNTKLAQ